MNLRKHPRINFANKFELEKAIKQFLTPIEQIKLGANIFTGQNQNTFVDSQNRNLDYYFDHGTDVDFERFYKEMDNTFIKIYNNKNKVIQFLVDNLFEVNTKYHYFSDMTKEKFNFENLDDACAEIFEY